MNAPGPPESAGDPPRPPTKPSPQTAANTATPPAPTEPPARPAGAGETEELIAAVQRVEQIAKEIERHVEAVSREEQHREFSFAWLIGALTQALVVGFLIAALADWIFRADPAVPLVKLAFAGVLQLGTLTAFMLARK